MVWSLIKKDLLENIVEFRFFIFSALIVSLMGFSGTILSLQYAEQLDEYDTMQAENRQLISQLSGNLKKLAQGLSGSETTFELQLTQLFRRPSKFQFINKGRDADFPNAVPVNVEMLGKPYTQSKSNFFMPRFLVIDWTFVISILMSFVALIFTYDAFSGERENGTLSSILSNSVSRSSLLLGKYIGASVTVGIPLLTGIVLNVLIIILSPVMVFSNYDFLRIFVIAGVSLVTISVFICIGLLVSSRCSNSLTSLVITLLIWVVLSLFLPISGGLLAKQLRPVPSDEVVEQRIQAAGRAVMDSFREKYGNDVELFTGDPERDKLAILAQKEVRKSQRDIRQDYEHAKLSQVAFSQNVVRLSPISVFQYIIESITNTGLPGYRRWIEQAKAYQMQFRTFIETKDAQDESSDHIIGLGDSYMSEKPVNPDEVPVLVEQPVRISAAFASSLTDVFLLFLYNIVLFVLVFVSFLKSDVRSV